MAEQLKSSVDLRSLATQIRNQKGPLDPLLTAKMFTTTQDALDLLDKRIRNLADNSFGLLPTPRIAGIHIDELSANKITTGTLRVGGLLVAEPQVSVYNMTGDEVAWLGVRKEATLAITGATNATPIVITTATHGYTTGDRTTVATVGGNTAANGTWTVAVLSATTFSLNGSVGNGAYTSGGTSQRLFEGAWFKTLRIGGTGPASAKIIAQNDGSTSINGATFTLTLNSVTTQINNAPGFGGVNGFLTTDNSTGEHARIGAAYVVGRNSSLNDVFALQLSANAGALLLRDATGAPVISLTASNGVAEATQLALNSSAVTYLGATSATATGGGGTLPANPVGFINCKVGATSYRIPYYAA